MVNGKSSAEMGTLMYVYIYVSVIYKCKIMLLQFHTYIYIYIVTTSQLSMKAVNYVECCKFSKNVKSTLIVLSFNWRTGCGQAKLIKLLKLKMFFYCVLTLFCLLHLKARVFCFVQFCPTPLKIYGVYSVYDCCFYCTSNLS